MLPDRDSVEILILVTMGLTSGCGNCGDTYLYQTIYGGGTVSISLSSETAVSGVAGSGTAVGWDPRGTHMQSEFTPGGAYFLRSQSSFGLGCVELTRTDETICTASLACIEWRAPDTAYPELGVPIVYEADADTSAPGNQAKPTSTFTATSVGSGSLTLDSVTWDNPDCGISSISMEWAFDEENPYEDFRQVICE